LKGSVENLEREIRADFVERSEAAVKKHVNAMLSKYGRKNRTQLARAILDGRSPYE